MTWQGKQQTEEEKKREEYDLMIHDKPWVWNAMFTGEEALYLGKYGEWLLFVKVSRMQKFAEGISATLSRGKADDPETVFVYSDDAARAAFRKAIYALGASKQP